MSIRIDTKLLVELLGDLALTAGRGLGYATDGVLLHTARGHVGDDPGEQTLLVGTSTDRVAAGHTHVPAAGSLPPMLWPITDVDAVLAVLAKIGKPRDHLVEISRVGDEVCIAEDPDLLGDGTSIRFTVGPIADFPRGVWQTLGHIDPRPVVEVEGRVVPAEPHMDYAPGRIGAFVKIAARRGESLRVWSHHHRRAVHIQIGDHYRGLLAAQIPDTEIGDGPDVDVHAPDLPPADETLVDRLLGDAADLVITTQSATVRLLQRKLRVTEHRAGQLLAQLEERGIVAPPYGASTTREVLTSLGEKRAVLNRIADLAGGDDHA